MPKKEAEFFKNLLQSILPFAIIGMVGMQIKLLTDVTTLKAISTYSYSKNDAIADWRVQDQKDSGLSDRMNSIANRINLLEERVSKVPSK